MAGPRLIIALDFAGAAEANALVGRLDPARCRLKVGLELYTAAGPDFVRGLIERGFDVFLDLKLHDIPNTVARACRQAAALGVWMLTVHCSGGREMLRAARDVRGGAARPHIVGVTLLTSLGQGDVNDIGLTGTVDGVVGRLAALAVAAGLDGVVCAPPDAAPLRGRFARPFLLVTPGIRPEGAAAGDQQRVLTPRAAIAAGADFLVIGRPVTGAADPLAALRAIEAEIGDD